MVVCGGSGGLSDGDDAAPSTAESVTACSGNGLKFVQTESLPFSQWDDDKKERTDRARRVEVTIDEQLLKIFTL